MKKLLTIATAGAMLLGSLGVASAMDVKVNGQWEFHYGYYSRSTLMKASETDGKHQDRLRMRHRLRTQVQFIADENLSAMLSLELGDIDWGESGNTGQLDADGKDVKIKHAYLDWTLPGTQVKTRMGVQGLRLPWTIAGNPIMDADVAGVTVSTQFTPEVGLTVFYARPYDGSFDQFKSGAYEAKNQYDEMDMVGFMVPIRTSAIRATPWAMGAMIGKDSGFYTSKRFTTYNRGTIAGNKKVDNDTYGYWFGSTFEVPALDPFIAKIDAMAGGLRTGDSDIDSFGYMVVGQLGYKFDFGTLSLKGWYSSGNKDKDDNGTMPIVSDDNGFLMTAYGLDGQRWRAWDAIVSDTGLGMWGVGLELANVSFVDKLSHTVKVFWMRGTNEGDSYDGGAWKPNNMLTSDSAWEVNLENTYQVSPNLSLALDFAYVDLSLSKQRIDEGKEGGSFATLLGVRYAF